MNKQLTYLLCLSGLILMVSCHSTDKSIQLPSGKIAVGVYNGNGASPVCVVETIEALKLDSAIIPEQISAVNILEGKLAGLDVLIFPGGSGSQQFNSLGDLAIRKIKDFGKLEGKGLIGICAGGYLLASTENYPNLKILPVSHVREHYDRGRGLISFSQNSFGDSIFPEHSKIENLFIQYYDGPVFIVPDTTDVHIMATINTDIAVTKGAPSGVTPQKPAFLYYENSDGRVVVSVGHPEATTGMRWMVSRMARLAANKPIISYPTTVVRPNLYDKEILFFSELVKFEKDQFWKLTENDAYSVAIALDHLKSIHSRPSIRWAMGLLRNQHELVRLKAAEYLLFTEYTDALPDLKMVYEQEENEELKEKLKVIYSNLANTIY